jgi:hypothetical protein
MRRARGRVPQAARRSLDRFREYVAAAVLSRWGQRRLHSLYVRETHFRPPGRWLIRLGDKGVASQQGVGQGIMLSVMSRLLVGGSFCK